jgi:hypothetical protein
VNTLKLRFITEYDKTIEKRDTVILHSLLTVDDHRLTDDETDMLHFDELIKSIYGYGYFEIYTCECGFAGCAGIWEDILVNQDGGTVLWTVPQPLKTPDEGETEYNHFIFDREQYRQAIQTGLDEAREIIKKHAGEISIGPDGFAKVDLLRLSTEKPEEIVDRRPSERIFAVSHDPVLVEDQYICRIVSEECLGKWVGSWVEGWTGTHWTKDMNPSISMNKAIESPSAPISILAKAGVPSEPFSHS